MCFVVAVFRYSGGRVRCHQRRRVSCDHSEGSLGRSVPRDKAGFPSRTPHLRHHQMIRLTHCRQLICAPQQTPVVTWPDGVATATSYYQRLNARRLTAPELAASDDRNASSHHRHCCRRRGRSPPLQSACTTSPRAPQPISELNLQRESPFWDGRIDKGRRENCQQLSILDILLFTSEFFLSSCFSFIHS